MIGRARTRAIVTTGKLQTAAGLARVCERLLIPRAPRSGSRPGGTAVALWIHADAGLSAHRHTSD